MHEQNSIFDHNTVGSLIPKELRNVKKQSLLETPFPPRTETKKLCKDRLTDAKTVYAPQTQFAESMKIDVLKFQPRSDQRQCMCKIWSNFNNFIFISKILSGNKIDSNQGPSLCCDLRKTVVTILI